MFPSRDVNSLAATLRRAISDRGELRRMGEAARERMASWSLVDYAHALIEAVSRAVEMRGKSN